MGNQSLFKINLSQTGELPVTHKLSVIATTESKVQEFLKFSDLAVIEVSNTTEFLLKHNLKIIKKSIKDDNVPDLGRVEKKDDRDLNYLISEHLSITKTSPKITSKYWQSDLWWGDQGSTPQCVGYAWAHWFDDGPITHRGPYPSVNPSIIYTEAQKLDEWPGENYAGTSVRGGAKYLKASGKIRSYLWAFNVTTLINTVLSVGPVVVGTNWYTGMFYPDRNGLIRISGRIAGGHAYQINGVDTVTQRFRIKNSWGKSWGQQGHAFISFTDMTRLINERGEICLAVENNF
jgi:hypothetical protein